ncbi:MAG: hypothetical protein R3A12_14075 [Ignavibacteria bacterium]
MKKDQIIIIMNYKGKGFDPNDIKNPDMKEYFSKFKVGGTWSSDHEKNS